MSILVGATRSFFFLVCVDGGVAAAEDGETVGGETHEEVFLLLLLLRLSFAFVPEEGEVKTPLCCRPFFVAWVLLILFSCDDDNIDEEFVVIVVASSNASSSFSHRSRTAPSSLQISVISSTVCRCGDK